MDGTFVEALAGAVVKPIYPELDGKTRLVVPEGWTEIEPKAGPTPAALTVSTLTGILTYLEANRDKLQLGDLAVHVIDQTHVALVSNLQGDFQQRHRYVVAKFDGLFGQGFGFGQYLDHETFVIGLQSLFVQTETRDKILTLLAGIRESEVRDNFDDGVAQSVKVAAGVALVGDVKVPNPVELQPFRTFREIEQPSSLFVLRLQAGSQGAKPKVALIEADGGAWRLTAIERIADYLRKGLKAEVAVLA